MKIADFVLEKWLNPLDPVATYQLGASCVKALHMDEFFELIGEDVDEFYAKELKEMSLHYGYFFGMPRLLEALSTLYRDVTPHNVLSVHGGTGANNMVLTELIEPTDNVVAIVPNYQQHYSIPESLGADVRKLSLRLENDYLPDLDELEQLVDGNTKVITMSNPNNPTGSFVTGELLDRLVEIADRHGTWILSDEIYRGLDDDYMPSIVDVYDRGIVTSSMSKVFSMAGTRVGWIVLEDLEMRDRLENRRSYDTICVGPFDELMAAKAIENSDKILGRARGLVRGCRAVLDEWLPTQPELHTTAVSHSPTTFVTYDFDVETVALCDDIFAKTGVVVCHGECFEVPKSFRIGYGFGEVDHFRTGLGVLGDYLDTLRK